MIVKTCMGSKLPFIYLLSTVFIVYYIDVIAYTVIYNWSNWGWTMGLDTEDEKPLHFYANLLIAFGCFVFYEGHWLFSWRYFEISEFLASQN